MNADTFAAHGWSTTTLHPSSIGSSRFTYGRAEIVFNPGVRDKVWFNAVRTIDSSSFAANGFSRYVYPLLNPRACQTCQYFAGLRVPGHKNNGRLAVSQIHAVCKLLAIHPRHRDVCNHQIETTRSRFADSQGFFTTICQKDLVPVISQYRAKIP